MSLDGFVAGPAQSVTDPFGVGGMRLHEWVFPLAAFRREHGMEGGIVNESTPVVEEALAGIGATVTHHAREPLALDGGTTFTFVTDGITPAVTHLKFARR